MTTSAITALTPSQSTQPYYLNHIPAGFPSPAQDVCEGRVSLDALLGLNFPQIYIARASGTSMEGIGIYDGDFLVIDRSRKPANGQVVIAAVNGEPLVKTYVKDAESVILRSHNPDFQDYVLSEGDELEVWGVVTNSIRRHV